MSLAPFLMARPRMELPRRMMGASSLALIRSCLFSEASVASWSSVICRSRMNVELGEIDVLNAHLLAGGFNALRKDGGESQADLGISEEEVLKIFLLEHGASCRLKRADAGGARLACEQAHFAKVLSGAHFC